MRSYSGILWKGGSSKEAFKKKKKKRQGKDGKLGKRIPQPVMMIKSYHKTIIAMCRRVMDKGS